MTDKKRKLQDAVIRSLALSERIRQRADMRQKEIIENAPEPDFGDLESFAVSRQAWDQVCDAGIAPKLVFAHPDILAAHPGASLYYRGLALLSQKRVTDIIGAGIAAWEEDKGKNPPSEEKRVKAAQLFNAVISSIIEGRENWTLENGYRNILATTGITLDGFFRNKIGQDAEELVKFLIVEWLNKHECVRETAKDRYILPKETIMRYGSEPDIEISREGKIIATIEVKGGKDPAGALERLGAMQKSFEETPPDCANFLVAGVITSTMKERLAQMGRVKDYDLDRLATDQDYRDEFMREVFHYAARII